MQMDLLLRYVSAIVPLAGIEFRHIGECLSGAGSNGFAALCGARVSDLSSVDRNAV